MKNGKHAALSLSLCLMATHIVSWGGNDSIVSPVISSVPSIVSIDFILPHKRTTTSAFQGASGPESLAKRMSSLPVEPRSEASTSASIYQSADLADEEFIRHHKYFFKDGNVTFLVRGPHQWLWRAHQIHWSDCIQVDGTLYCIHRYFFSRDSLYFSTRFDQLETHDHEALPITISLGNVERKDFEAFLSILYPA